MTVVAVFTPDFGLERLRELAARGPVWIVNSSQNKEVAKRIWAESGPGTVTVFNADGDSPSLEARLSIVEVIDRHADEYGGDFDLEVIGVPLSDRAKAILADAGFEGFEPASDGFKAFRHRTSDDV